MTLFVDPTLKPHFPQELCVFEHMMSLQGEVFRHQEGRKTQRITINGQYYFIKQHSGIGWKEIFKNLIALRRPVLSAYAEQRALQHLQQLGIDVPQVLAYGWRLNYNIAAMRSFILTKELSPTISLADFCQHWRKSPPSFALKQSIIAKVAHIAKMMHVNKMNHRDFYLCHFLLDTSQAVHPSNIKLYLIDLHRAQFRHRFRKRWIIKDLAGLYFSSKHCGLTSRDVLRFVKIYQAQSLRNTIEEHSDFWQQVKNRGEALYYKLNTASMLSM